MPPTVTVFDKIYHVFFWLRELFVGSLGRALGSESHGLVIFLDALIGIIIMAGGIVAAVLAINWVERRGLGKFQIRPGPNRTGPFGLLQPIADALKLLTKEDIVPARADKWVHRVAPVVAFVPTLMFLAVIPISDGAVFADLNIGILYVVAIGSLGVIAMFMAGWGSNNKYSAVGGMRAVAQLISYEIPMVLAILGVVLAAGSLQMGQIVERQTVPFLLLQPAAFLIYFIGATAELNRSPMDLLEAESEIVAGYSTEYSGMKWAMFFLAEYGNTFIVATITTTLFLSGWKGGGLPPWLWFLVKTSAVYFVLLWMRATLPRLRVDQLMAFAWKFLLPLALINVFVIAFEVLAWDRWLPQYGTFPWPFLFLNAALAAVLIWVWSRVFFRFGGGRVEVPVVPEQAAPSPASSGLRPEPGVRS